MTGFLRKHLITAMLAGTLVLAAASGFLASSALSVGTQATRTVTINVAPGPKGDPGPPGPVGPRGPAGTSNCPSGFSEGDLVINHPGGQTTIFTCIKA